MDDDAEIRSILKDLLEPFCDVETRESARRALADLAGIGPDLVLLDVNMPGMSGLEALAEIKALAPHLPVVMVTGTAELSIVEDALRLGAFASIAKPFRLADVERVVRTALAARRAC